MRLLFLTLLLSSPAIVADSAVTPATTGQFRLSTPIASLTDQDTLRSLREVVTEDSEVEWEIYVPENYSTDDPAGIMVNISPTNSGRIPRRWKEVLDRNNLIWIGANRSGNEVMTMRRMLFAALAPPFIQKQYVVNSERIYVTGLSGGGRVSSLVAIEFARLFQGAIYICGVNPPRNEQPELLNEVRGNRYVFLTGSRDFNEAETRQVYKTYLDMGVQNARLMVVPHMTHRNPDADDFETAVQYLDGVAQ
jgi:hypothetical protein